MKVKDIKENIKIDYNAPGCANAAYEMDADFLNKDVFCKVGDVLKAGAQENEIVEISFVGNSYSLMVKINNGQKINMKTLGQLIENNQIVVK